MSVAKRFKRYTEEEILGEHFSRFYTDEDRASGLPARALATAAREGRFEQEGWRVRNGTWSEVPVILATGYSEVRTRTAPEERLATPFTQNDLAQAVAAAVARPDEQGRVVPFRRT